MRWQRRRNLEYHWQSHRQSDADDGGNSSTWSWTGELQTAWDTSGNFSLVNTTAATSGTPHSSPTLTLTGTYWTGAASANAAWTIQEVNSATSDGNNFLQIAGGVTANGTIVEIGSAAHTTAGHALFISDYNAGVCYLTFQWDSSNVPCFGPFDSSNDSIFRFGQTINNAGGNFLTPGTEGISTPTGYRLLNNNGSTATVVNKLAIESGGTATVATTSSTHGVLGVVMGGAGTSGQAAIAVSGQAKCIFDGAITQDDYVQASTTAG